MNKLQVVVIGAGAAGLAAASRLSKNGLINLTLVEASDRIGGRVNSVKLNGNDIEMGAQWIHGQAGNVAFQIAKEIGIIDDPEDKTLEDMGEDFFFEDGEAVDDEVMDKLWQIAEYAEEEQEKYDFKKSESMGNFYDKIFEQQKNSSVTPKLLNAFKDYLHKLYHSLDSCDNWYQLSFEGTVHRYQKCEGNEMITFKSENKYLDLLEHLKKDIPDKSILFNRSVVGITDCPELKVKVKLQNDEILEADYVIFTPSLGVLKTMMNIFEPSLPTEKILAIEKMGFGTVNKIFMEFDQVWWPTDDTEGFAFLFNDNIEYCEEYARKDWTRFIMGLYRVAHRDKVLAVWIGSAGARYMESLSNDQIQLDVMSFIRKFLRKKYPNIPDPVGLGASRWFSNCLTRGCYSFHSVDTIEAGVSIQNLAKPFGRILFAGEATHEKYFSTVHGAIETGWREADRIIEMQTKQQE